MDHNTKYDTKTAQEKLAELAELGITGEVANVIIRQTAPQRHEFRIRATVRYALVQAGGPVLGLEECEHLPDDLDPDYVLRAAVLLAADVVGVGGPGGLGGPEAATERLVGRANLDPPVHRLGKGRRQATDGPAYLAAAVGALHRLESSVRADWVPSDQGICLETWDGAYRCHLDVLPAPWRRSLALNMGLAATGPWVPWHHNDLDDPGIFACWRFDGGSAKQQWCRAVDYDVWRATVVAQKDAEG